jgi:hypothetical protein
MSDVALEMSVGDNYLPPVLPAGELQLRPANVLDNLATWLAMAGVLLLLAGGVIIASVMWFGSILFAGATPDEGPGE